MEYIILFILWIGTGLYDAGKVKAYFTGNYPDVDIEEKLDISFYIMCILGGPIGIITSWACGFYGHGWEFPFRVRSKTIE